MAIPAPTPPPYGLTGANAALGYAPGVGFGGGAGAGYGMMGGSSNPNAGQINVNRDLAMKVGNTGIGAVQGFVQPGIQAQQLQAALSGTLGQQAQQQAYNNFTASPGQQWLQEQAERGTTRNAAAIGGLGGGNVRAELQRQAMGLAQQDMQNQFNNAGAVADRGMQGASLANNLYNMQGQAATSAGAQHAGVESSNIGASASGRAAQIAADAGLKRDAGLYAFTAGQNIGDNRAATTSALAQLANMQGSGLSDLQGGYTGNIANLLTGAGGAQASSNANLSNLLANLASGNQSNYVNASQLPAVGQTAGNLGGMGDLLGGVGSLAKVMGWGAA